MNNEKLIWFDLLVEMKDYFLNHSFSNNKIFVGLPATISLLKYPFIILDFENEKDLNIFDNGLNMNSGIKQLNITILQAVKNTHTTENNVESVYNKIFGEQNLLKTELYNYFTSGDELTYPNHKYIYSAKINNIEPVNISNKKQKSPVKMTKFDIEILYNIKQLN